MHIKSLEHHIYNSLPNAPPFSQNFDFLACMIHTARCEVLGRELTVRFFWRKTAKSVGASEGYKNPCRLGFVELRPLFDRQTPWGQSALCFVEVEAVCASKVRLLSIFRQIYLVHVNLVSHSRVNFWTIFGKAIYHMC